MHHLTYILKLLIREALEALRDPNILSMAACISSVLRVDMSAPHLSSHGAIDLNVEIVVVVFLELASM
jgi:hypothetical protein